MTARYVSLPGHTARAQVLFAPPAASPAGHRDALARAMILAAAADAEISPAELAALREGLALLPAWSGADGAQLERIVLEAREWLSAVGVEAAIRELALDLPSPAARREGYLCAALVCLADGRLQREERTRLDLLRDGLLLPPALARALLDELMAESGVAR